MLIRRKKGWELPERIATPEARYVDRRRLLAGMGIGGLILAAPAALGQLGPKSDAASRVVPRHSARPDEAFGMRATRLIGRLQQSDMRRATTISTNSVLTRVSPARRKPFESGRGRCTLMDWLNRK